MGRLTIKILGCKNLPKKDANGFCDPYVIIKVEEGKWSFRTKTINKNRNPTFNEKFEIENTHRYAKIEIIVMDYDSTSADDVMGRLELSLNNLQKGVPKTVWHYIVAHAGEKNRAEIQGKIGIEIMSPDFGEDGEINTELEEHYRSRLRRLRNKYCRHIMHTVDYDLSTALQDADWASYLKQSVTQYGPEPGTTIIDVGISKGSDFSPKVDPYIVLYVEHEEYKTNASKGANPTFSQNNHVKLDITDPKCASLRAEVWDDCVTGDTLIGEAVFSFGLLAQAAASTYDVPVISQGNQLKGYLQMTFMSADYGRATGGQPVTLDYKRLARFLSYYDPVRMRQLDCMLTAKPGSDPSAALVTELINQYGRELGTSQLQVTVKEVTGLTKNGKLVKKPDPYVKVFCAGATHKTKTKKNSKVAVFDEQFNIHVPRPETTDYVEFGVYDDDCGTDHDYGRTQISLKTMQQGVPKICKLPVIGSYSDKTNATVTGYVTVQVSSAHFGSTKAHEPETEQHYRQRVFAFFKKYSKHEMYQADVFLGREPDYNEYIEKLLNRFGPEPGTCRVAVKIIGCKDLLRVDTFGGCDPYIVLKASGDTFQTKTISSNLNPDFNETFQFDLTNPSQEQLEVKVWDEDVDDDDEVGTVMLSFNNLQKGVEKVRTYPLIQNPGTAYASQKGNITISMLTNTFGYEQPIPDDTAIRERVVKQLTQYHKADLHRVDVKLGEYLFHEEELITALVEMYGIEPDSLHLRIRVVGCRHLPAGDYFSGTSDPYVKVYLNGMNVGKTSVIKNSLNPDFPAELSTFSVSVLHPNSDVLRFKVKDSDLISSDELGNCYLAVSNVVKGAQGRVRWNTVWTPTNPSVQAGTIGVELFTSDFGHAIELYSEKMETHIKNILIMKKLGQSEVDTVFAQIYSPGLLTDTLSKSNQLFNVKILEGRNLPKMDTFGTCDAYAILKLLTGDKRTKVIKNTLNPKWDSENEFLLDVPEDDTVSRIELWDEDAFSDDFIGVINISFSPLFWDQDETRWYPIMMDYGTKTEKVAGEILIQVHRIVNGVGELADVPPELQAEAQKLNIHEHSGKKMTSLVTSEYRRYWYDRLKTFFGKYDVSSLGQLDLKLNTWLGCIDNTPPGNRHLAANILPAEIAKEVKKWGPEVKEFAAPPLLRGQQLSASDAAKPHRDPMDAL